MQPKSTSIFSQTGTRIPPKSNVRKEDKKEREMTKSTKINFLQLFSKMHLKKEEE